MSTPQALGRLSKDLAIDLGTANTLVYARGRGIVVDEPSVVAVRVAPNGAYTEVLAIGEEARVMLGRTPGNIAAVRPLKDGVIADFEVAEQMIRYFILRATGRQGLFKPRMLVCIPSGVTEVEKRAVLESARAAGAKEVFLVPEPLAAALGAGLPVMEPTGTLVVDIGGGTTEVAVISMGGLVRSRSLRVAGDHMDKAIIQSIRDRKGLIIGERTAEAVKLDIGCATPLGEPRTTTVKGRDAETGIPRQVTLTGADIGQAVSGTLSRIVEAIRETLETTPPELGADLIDRGIVLCGGGSLLPHIEQVIADATGLPCSVAEDPMTAVARGAGQALEDPEILARVALS